MFAPHRYEPGDVFPILLSGAVRYPCPLLLPGRSSPRLFLVVVATLNSLVEACFGITGILESLRLVFTATMLVVTSLVGEPEGRSSWWDSGGHSSGSSLTEAVCLCIRVFIPSRIS